MPEIRRTIFFLPPLAQVSGGLRMLHATIRSLCALGNRIAVTTPPGGRHPFDTTTLEGSENVEILPWPPPCLGPQDLWVIPESWPNALAPGLNAGARTIVYAQSWSFLLTGLPVGVHWKHLPVSYLAVSRPVAWFMEHFLELPPPALLPPMVEGVFFEAGRKKDEAHAANTDQRPVQGGRVRVAWMPRKNRALAEHIRLIAEACLAKDSLCVEWVSLHRLSVEEVARQMASCHIFLVTAFPEGFGLPPLEAMAAGCVPVGFTGFGGWDYMRQTTMPESCRGFQAQPQFIDALQMGAYAPCFPLEEKPWEGNGLYVADGDVMGAGLALASMIRLAYNGGDAWDALRRNGARTADHYSEAKRHTLLASLWPRLCAS